MGLSQRHQRGNSRGKFGKGYGADDVSGAGPYPTGSWLEGSWTPRRLVPRSEQAIMCKAGGKLMLVARFILADERAAPYLLPSTKGNIRPIVERSVHKL